MTWFKDGRLIRRNDGDDGGEGDDSGDDDGDSDDSDSNDDGDSGGDGDADDGSGVSISDVSIVPSAKVDFEGARKKRTEKKLKKKKYV